jgi:hypothetical protein
MFMIDHQITYTGEELFKGNACQGRPTVRCPSVPVGSAIMPKTSEEYWACHVPHLKTH